MVDINEGKGNENDTRYAVETGDTISSALDPFGSNVGPIAGGAQNNKTREVTNDNEKQSSKNKD
ncbi:hypothetical protein [Bacillus sp. 1P02SD]|uniref:hypothetical protein n=1 Tax=Bacillus sp. 1P02SD TaxID=3132264 RepID=UPI0039A39A79